MAEVSYPENKSPKYALEATGEKKLMIVTTDDIEVSNGTTVRVKCVVEALRHYYSLTVISSSMNTSTSSLHSSVKHVCIKDRNQRLIGHKLILLKLISFVLRNLTLLFLLARHRNDLVYSCNDWVGFPALFIMTKIRRRKLIFEAHGILSDESREKGCSALGVWLRKIWEKWVIRSSDFVVALSPNISDSYSRFNSEIAVIPVFSCTDQVSFQRTNSVTENKSVGLVGPFDLKANTPSLEFLHKNIEKFDPRIQFVVIGRCNERIDCARIKYTGYLSESAKYWALLCQLDAVLVPTFVATSGPLNKIIEPMYCGVPVFTTPKGTVGLYNIEIGKDIIVCEIEELVDTLNKLLFDKDLMLQVSISGAKAVRQFYGFESNSYKLNQVIRSLLAR